MTSVAVAGSRRGHDEGGNALVAQLPVDGGKDNGHIGVGAVGDEHLVAIEDVLLSISHRARPQRGGVAAGLRLRQREASEQLSASERLEERLLLVFATKLENRFADQRVVDRQNHTAAGTDPTDLLDDEAVGQRIHPRAVVLLGYEDPCEAQLSGLGEELAWKIARLVDLLRLGPYHLLGELPHGISQQTLFFTELDTHDFDSNWTRIALRTGAD